ncbi:hypothetical protein EBR56_06065 [bacterium]|nr:hypothetical protein [bacterium]
MVRAALVLAGLSLAGWAPLRAAETDGLLALDGTSASLSDDELSAMIESTWLSPKSDDVSFVEVTFHVS